ncbi:tRNA (mnm(5)s(2)U34)-methyltransferase [Fructilactobacillus carniphilus]|uniref:Methyltransferase domain-containing protein n=1 Tax=Fructilactobacillus carniphilus TaxID=2940297 RepID=A0ABY5BWU8_9LACO|nr:class I SAM-dependent methyltransferase [Fructilactobacillus carniphilus]USS90967.1 methyltransferase domain-containing protein [Fructilactobacillus carniphilus]
MKLQSALHFSHTLLDQVVKPGDTVIDATAGMGNDTLKLAQLVGSTGHVYSFDIQKAAVTATKAKLAATGYQNATVVQLGHEQLDQVVRVPVKSAIFNLGYLPNGDHHVITHPETTITALEKCLALLEPLGLVIVVCYYGHPGGEAEKDQVLNWAPHLPQWEFNVLQYQFLNQVHQPPFLLAIQKR